ncbi:NAD-glutamate dehydrogenase [Candidatus Jidaibacter acanthamoeba]|uniref:NAD-glutamate dehydrogenase n=2 Tax=Candidatus Jidaibacter acanthamoebae TaxID=86105 RepID=A0A0C1N0Z1_9RICK|nr:NAD-glutamate dehydrogenase [Candidatus Jidaibacter acanthamoeba]
MRENFMAQNDLGNNELIIEQLTLKTNDKNLKQFIKILYSSLPYDELSLFETDYLFKAAASTFRLMQSKKDEETKLHIYKPNKDKEQIILEVINKDIPFLVDSISNQLKIEDFDIHLITHQAVMIAREEDGHFISFSESKTSSKESIIQFHISKWCGDEYLASFYHIIEQVLECVNLAVNDWQPMRKKMEDAKKLIENYKLSKDPELKEENIKFLNWLINGNFVFVGCYESKIINSSVIPEKDSVMGGLKNKAYYLEESHFDGQYESEDVLFITKWDGRSLVHRTSHMDHVIIKEFNDKGKCIRTLDFLGFFTSSVYYQSVKTIPLIRKKVFNVIEKYGYPEYSHNCKELVTALENFPRGELIQMHEDELLETAKGIVSLALMPKVKLFVRQDTSKKFITCLIFIPKSRFSTEVRETIESMLCNVFNGVISSQHVNISESQLANLQITLKTEPNNIPRYDVTEIEESIVKAISVWGDYLLHALGQKYSRKDAKAKYLIYKDAFDIKYTSSFTAKEAVNDIEIIEASLQDNTVKFNLYEHEESDKRVLQLKIFSPDERLALSSTLPILEHIGFFASDVLTFKVSLKDLGAVREFYIHHFRLQFKLSEFNLTNEFKDNIEIALNKIWDQSIEDDRFNSLILFSNLNWRQANLLRAYSKYLKQINFQFTLEYVVDALVNNYELTKLLVELFELRFNPNRERSEADINKLIAHINEKLAAVKSITEDKVIKTFLNIIQATKRTNYFQTYENNQYKDYLSLKIASSEVMDIPLPKPYAEIFVFSKRVEAVHLRGGKVARGGLRWSDRSEDFRTEVLGLMKAQMTKNAVIVPVGSKGGFVLKSTTLNMSREEVFQEAIDCYKTFLSGLLDVTDNIVDGKVVAPKDVVRFDDEDPYLVVAADKGTATFSDHANEVSLKYNFWLGDAFASGGSAGYDHKKLGITAKGAWVSVERHFRELGMDIEKDPFTVVGIGDMSGDVFGNGMLLSQNIKLIAAFNHIHIFIDPNPEPEASFKERERLFYLPRSQWSDYNAKLISEGGGIFSRTDKAIKLSSQIKQVLDITEDLLSPDALIKAILEAPVDLLWNGGIGTYVKATSQTNDKIGDKANDNLRVNGKDLRCKVIGEGGNLGFTQLGRIEYAKGGGKINTDFIDNSAGVDCSDHEVNIKIAFSEALNNSKITLEERNIILDQMKDEVSELVLQDNMKQTQIISIEEERGNENLDQHAWLIKRLESKKELDRDIEFLPSIERISTLKAEGGKLTRPEISVLVAYSKNSIFNMLSEYDFLKDKFFYKYLLKYFPTVLREKSKDLIIEHKLKNQIVATMMTNDFVNMLGCCYFHQLLDDTSHDPEDLVKAFTAIREIFDISKYWKLVEDLTGNVPPHIKILLFKELQTLLKRNISWFLRHNHSLNNLDDMVKKYKDGVDQILSNYNELVSNTLLSEIELFTHMFEGYDIPLELMNGIIALKAAVSACDIVVIADIVKENVLKVAKAFYLLGEKMHLNWMLSQAKKYTSNQYIENVALRSIVSEIEDIHMELTKKEILLQKETVKVIDDSVEACCLVKTSDKEQYNQFISELKASHSDSWVSLLIIAVRRVKELMNA